MKEFIVDSISRETLESTTSYYTANRVYISLNDEDGNSHETKLFKSKEDAFAQLKKWRADELDLRKESAAAYEILTDNKDSFRMAWDNERELLSIGVS